MLVLGLETSCDETGVALYDSEQGLLADALFSQIDLHRVYGGVVPELASRDHVKRMLPLIRQVLADAERDAAQIDAIAYTAGPGLVGALLVGASCAQALAFAWGIPAVPAEVCEAYGGQSLEFGREYIIPKPMDPRLITLVSDAVAKAAIESGVATLPYPASYPLKSVDDVFV